MGILLFLFIIIILIYVIKRVNEKEGREYLLRKAREYCKNESVKITLSLVFTIYIL